MLGHNDWKPIVECPMLIISELLIQLPRSLFSNFRDYINSIYLYIPFPFHRCWDETIVLNTIVIQMTSDEIEERPINIIHISLWFQTYGKHTTGFHTTIYTWLSWILWDVIIHLSNLSWSICTAFMTSAFIKISLMVLPLGTISISEKHKTQKATQIAKFIGPTRGPPGSCRPQMDPMLAPWTLLSVYLHYSWITQHIKDWVWVRSIFVNAHP